MTIPIPTPPTDSLYKFMVVAGIVLGVTCLLAIQYTSDALADRMDGVMLEIAKLEFEAEGLSRDVDLLERRTSSSQTPALLNELRARNRQIGMKTLERQHASKRLSRLAETTFSRQRVLAYLGSLAIGLVVAGFLLWYFRLQRHQDVLMSLQVVEATARVAAAKRSSTAGPTTT